MEEAGGAWRWRRAAPALPGVETNMMVIAAGRDEGGLLTVALFQLEAEHAAVEGERAVEVGDLRCTWPIRAPGSIGRGVNSGSIDGGAVVRWLMMGLYGSKVRGRRRVSAPARQR